MINFFLGVVTTLILLLIIDVYPEVKNDLLKKRKKKS